MTLLELGEAGACPTWPCPNMLRNALKPSAAFAPSRYIQLGFVRVSGDRLGVGSFFARWWVHENAMEGAEGLGAAGSRCGYYFAFPGLSLSRSTQQNNDRTSDARIMLSNMCAL